MKSSIFRRTAAFVAVAVSGAMPGCGESAKHPGSSDVKFDAAHSVALDGVIDEGRIIATSDDVATIKDEIAEQLIYTIGQFNGWEGVPDQHRLETTVTEVTERADGAYDVKYAAKLFVSWPRETSVPASVELVMPARGDFLGLSAFYQAYGADEATTKRCMAWEAHDVSMGIFWYYYRPLKASCALRNPALDDVAVVARFPMRLALSGENSSGKFPEYAKVWEDGKLVVTAIFGKNEAGATDNFDAGISAFRATYRDLLDAFGQPLTSNLGLGEEPSAAHDDVRLTFATVSGALDVHLYLVDGIRTVGSAFRQKYNDRTKVSDYVSYSGHSGLGANIRALARMGQFIAGQYQIFLINGCDTFAYVDGSLRQAHQDANPGSGPDQYFDMITNAMPSYFHMNSTSNLAVVRGLVGQSKTYRQILAGFDESQRAAVTGEQDNRWPAPFEP